MKVQWKPRRVCAGSVSDVMSSKVGTCLAIKSSLSRSITVSQAIYSSKTFITGMFDLALHFQAAWTSLTLITV